MPLLLGLLGHKDLHAWGGGGRRAGCVAVLSMRHDPLEWAGLRNPEHGRRPLLLLMVQLVQRMGLQAKGLQQGRGGGGGGGQSLHEHYYSLAALLVVLSVRRHPE